MKRIPAWIVQLIAVASGCYGQDPSTNDLLTSILQELKGIRAQFETYAPRAQAPTERRVELATHGAPFLGREDAPLTIVNFTDFECPYCNQFFRQTFADLKNLYIDTGKVRFYSMDFPLSGIHATAMGAALAGRCANEQGQFWPMHHHMQENPKHLSPIELIDAAATLPLDLAKFRDCLDNKKYSADVEKDIRAAEKIGVTGTPSFIVGRSTPEGVVGEIVAGAVALGIFQRTLERSESDQPE